MSKALATQETPKPVEAGKITTRVLEQIDSLRSKGMINLPDNYDVGNALNSAWLEIQTVQNKDKRPVIKNGNVDTSVVTINSVVNALHDYAIQGLNCMKDQCYFIVYGDALTMQRSYYGDMHLASTVRPNTEFYGDTIRKGEKFIVAKKWSQFAGLVSVVTEHEIPFPRAEEIVGVYAGAIDTHSGDDLGIVLMSFDEVKKSWSMSPTYKYSTKEKPTPHDKFPHEMALRTAFRKRATPIITTSGDATLLAAVMRQDLDQAEAEIAMDAEENANATVLELPPAPAVETPSDERPGPDEAKEELDF